MGHIDDVIEMAMGDEDALNISEIAQAERWQLIVSGDEWIGDEDHLSTAYFYCGVAIPGEIHHQEDRFWMSWTNQEDRFWMSWTTSSSSGKRPSSLFEKIKLPSTVTSKTPPPDLMSLA